MQTENTPRTFQCFLLRVESEQKWNNTFFPNSIPAKREDTSILNMPTLQCLNCIYWGRQVFNITSNFFKNNPFCILHYIVLRVIHLYSYIERYGHFGTLKIDARLEDIDRQRDWWNYNIILCC